MLLTIILSFLAGLWGANGIPHYITGVTGIAHPSPFGSSPVVNVLEGWVAFILGGVLWHFAALQNYPVIAYPCAALGVLVIALVHTQVWVKNPEFYKPKSRRTWPVQNQIKEAE
ncbi:hypothetical protein KSF_080440 [Reticulibacter mediterranei]|uniref:Uncharacterized protein n=1 Tax=Reticulibacter mediterranei TaxID=2778369 RepID=A0A8J3IXR0_9CHLR|nr:hypothetical protein [Reticulibacter mediterranei]GHO97996.1 hypothetical protein KSF_080440 [Reticulibacter mediterranei]